MKHWREELECSASESIINGVLLLPGTKVPKMSKLKITTEKEEKLKEYELDCIIYAERTGHKNTFDFIKRFVPKAVMF